MTIPPVPMPDKALMEKLVRFAEEARKEMGEQKWAELSAEWEQPQ